MQTEIDRQTIVLAQQIELDSNSKKHHPQSPSPRDI